MNRSSLAVALLSLVLVGGLALRETSSESSTDAAPSLRRAPPPPTPGPYGLEEAIAKKGDRKAWRKRWFKEMHRAAPGVDWAAMDRADGLARFARHQALRGAPPPDSVGVWVERGSDNQGGRMHAARRTADGATIYAGSALGGVWRGAADGSGWTPIGDALYGGAHRLLLVDRGGASPRVLAGTEGGLLHYTDDDGLSWQTPSGLEGLTNLRRLIQRPESPEQVFLIGHNGAEWGLYRSEDGGAAWSRLRALPAADPDLWTSRLEDGPLYLASAGALLRSEDEGDTWTAVGTFGGEAARADLCGVEAGGPTLYLVRDDATLLRSDDAGATFVEAAALSALGGDFWGVIGCSITDPQLVFLGGMEQWVSRDGGATAAKINDWWLYYSAFGGDERTKLHADTMGVDIQPNGAGGEIWYLSTDGGLYQSTDKLATVENLSLDGLRVSQYYDVHTSWANPEHVLAGAQDQGWQLTAWAEQDEDERLEFYQSMSGDYGHLTSGDETHAMVFSVYPGVVLISKGEDEPQLLWADFPTGERMVPWLPPIHADPTDPTVFFFPASVLYRYEPNRALDTWTPSVYSEGLSLGADEYISALAFSPRNPERAYLATNHGRVYTSNDKARTWVEADRPGPDENWYYGQAIAPSWTEPDTVTIGGSGYGEPAVYRSEDGGQTIFPWSEGLPDTLVYSMVEAMDGSGCVFAGTSNAAWVRCPDDAAWAEITDPTAPITLYWSVHALPHENSLRFGTYGRGIWDFKMETPACYPVVDADGDSVFCHEDCDDTNAAISPLAEEVPEDGLDNDCRDGDATLDPGGEVDGAGEGTADGAAEGEEAGEPVEPSVDAKKSGCACTQGGGAPVGGLALMGGLLALGLRRRRA